MSNIVKGSDMSNYVTTGMSLGVAKKANRDGITAKFVVFTVQDEDGGFSGSVRHIMFEEDLFPGAIELLAKYRMLDNEGKPVVDAKGGYPINMEALENGEDAKRFGRYLRVPGGMVMDYRLKKGKCYANDVDGQRVKDGRNQDVVKEVIPVFVQVKFFMVDENGKMTPNYANKMGLEERGDRLERQFYREPVNAVVVPQTGTPVNDTSAAPKPQGVGDPF